MFSSSNYFKNNKLFIFLIIITFLIKLSLAAYFSHLGDCKNPELSAGYLAKTTGDTFSYLGSVENYISEGVFYFWNGERKVFAGRMPYYGAPYYLLRLFFDKSLSSDFLILIQLFFDTLGTIYFAKLCRDVIKHKAGFWLGYLFYFLSFNYFENILFLSPESLSLSFMIFFFYAFQRYWSDKSNSMLWIANLSISLACILKPYLIPIYLLFLLIHAYREELLSFKQAKALITKSLFLVLPIILMISPWLIRNLITLKKPIVTQENMVAGYKETEADRAFRRFSGGWGADYTFWDAASAACYFKLDPPFKCTFKLPTYSVADGYTLDDIEDVRSDYLEFQKNPSPELEETVVNKFDHLTGIYRRERPFMFYLGSGFIRIKTMLWHTNNYNLPIHPSSPCFQPYQLWFKVVQAVIYHLSLFLGTAGILWLTFKRKISLLFAFVPIFLTCFFSFYVWNMEARYFTHAYPILLLGLVTILLWVYSTVKNFLIRRETLSYDSLD